MATWRECIPQETFTQHRAYRETTADTFGNGEHVWLNAIMFVRKQFTRTSHSCLYFIDNQQQPMLVTQFPYMFDEFRFNRIYTTLGLNHFQHNSCCVGSNCRFKGRDIMQRYSYKSGWQW
ncbi:hypothetical protein D1872_285860 [compost metagenome]